MYSSIGNIVARHRVLVAALIALIFVIGRTAWITDDAYITFRVVDNFIHGYGIRWNLIERGHVFTHPLWFFLVSILYLFTTEMYYSVLALSMGLSGAAFLIVPLFIFRSQQTALVWFACTLSSKVLIDFSTSGLETPLNLLLVSAIMATLVSARGFERGKLGIVACGLICFNRLDTALLIAPILSVFLWFHRKRRNVWYWTLISFLPTIAWALFSVWYFGGPFPVTALAKIDLDLSNWQRIYKGLVYTNLWVRNDFVSFGLLIFGLTGLLVSRSVWCAAWAIGIGLSCLYVLWVGGDFMLGRFYTLPVFASLYGIMLLSSRARIRPAIVGVCILAVSVAGDRAPLRAATDLTNARPSVDGGDGILVDERLFYFAHAGFRNRLGRTAQDLSIPHTSCTDKEERVMVSGNVGYLGWNSCRTRIIVDPTAITSPFLARLRPEPGYTRAGHLYRRIPNGYLDALKSGTPLPDPRLQRYYKIIQFVTDGPLWSVSRSIEAIKLAVGQYHYLSRSDEVSEKLLN